MSKLTLKTEGDTHLIVTRRFDAPPEAVYRAHTDPKIVQRWMLGPEGWSMPVCISDPRPGGKIRYEWEHPKQGGFHLTGEFIELTPYSNNHVVITFEPDGSGTLMTMRMTLPDEKTRATMLASGMEKGMEASYVRLENMTSELIPSPASR